MFTSKRLFLTAGILLVVLVAFYVGSGYFEHKQELLVNPQVTAAVIPEISTVQATSTGVTAVNLIFTLTPLAPITLSSAYFETITTPTERISLSQNTDGTLKGNLAIPPQWLSAPQTISFVLYVNGVKTSHIVRFSVTDKAITLPPDPGEAGETTLAGIDSNHDGVRDDLEREIVFMYPGNDTVRRILRAETKVAQEVLLNNGNHDYYVNLLQKEFAFDNCYKYTEFGLKPADGNSQFLHDLLKNTPERKKVYEDHNKIALPFDSTINFNSEACTQPLVQGQY